MPTVTLTNEAYAVLCGLVQDEDDVNSAGIFTQHWTELRMAFPLGHFEQYAKDHPDFYDPEAGL